ncbi:MAG: holo-ACP synthase [Bacillota bacterium]|nr:holo-ACP synthase [Bacillota bacterium]
MLRIGTDIIEISRIEKNMENRHFIEKIYHQDELESLGQPVLAQSLAARFAAKEAVIKALGQAVPFRDIIVLREALGAPRLELRGKAREAAESLGLIQWEITLSHCKEYAVAFVVAQGS